MSYERRKVRVGKVVSDKMDKTVVVVVEWHRPHRVYTKPVRRETRFKAHDPQNECKLGDVVRIRECRPLSKTKRWRIEEILQREDIAEIQPQEIVVEDESVLTSSDEPSIEQAESQAGTEAAVDVVTEDNQPDAVDAVADAAASEAPIAGDVSAKVVVGQDAPPADEMAEPEAVVEEAVSEGASPVAEVEAGADDGVAAQDDGAASSDEQNDDSEAKRQ